jgi:HPt (histidine-containing phosphotransfer) domain-containing protein
MSIDPAALDSYREFMGEEADAFIDDIVSSYRDNAPKLMDAIAGSLPANDFETFTRAAHTLKSNSATIGATALTQLSAEMENLGKTEDAKALEEYVTKARLVLQSVLEELKQLYP